MPGVCVLEGMCRARENEGGRLGIIDVGVGSRTQAVTHVHDNFEPLVSFLCVHVNASLVDVRANKLCTVSTRAGVGCVLRVGGWDLLVK